MTREEQWETQYNNALICYELYGNINVSPEYELSIGDKKVKLGHWLRNQRKKYKLNKLTPDQINKLDKLGFSWESCKIIDGEKISLVNARIWLEKYNIAKKYYTEHNHLLVPVTYIVALSDGKKFNLSYWLNTQKNAYRNKSLPKYKIDLLEDIGMQWSYRECKAASYINLVATRTWLERFNLVKKYYDEHGDILIPEKYCVFIDGKKIILRNWLIGQRRLYKQNKLSQEQMNLLESIGMNWYVDDKTRLDNIRIYSLKQWYKKYDAVEKAILDGFKIYSFPGNYKLTTADGETFFVKTWLNSQNNKYNEGSLNEEQISLLENIGLILYKKTKIKK